MADVNSPAVSSSLQRVRPPTDLQALLAFFGFDKTAVEAAQQRHNNSTSSLVDAAANEASIPWYYRWVALSGAYTYAAKSVAIAYLAYRARQPHRDLQDMLTFIGSLVPSEYSLHLLLFQSLMSFAAYKLWQRVRMILWPHTRGWTLPCVIAMMADSVAIHSFLVLAFYNLIARYKFRQALSSQGIPLRSLARTGFSLGRLLLILVPIPSLMARLIQFKRSEVYAKLPSEPTVPGSLTQKIKALRKETHLAETDASSQASNRPPSPKGSSLPLQIQRDDVALCNRRMRVKKLKLDVYWHQFNKKPNAPVLLYIHGGGWVTGHKQFHSIPLIYQVAKAGWLVVTINYRLCSMPGVRIVPEQLSDCKRAVAWVRENAYRFGADGSFIVVAGESAGGHLATLLTLSPNEPEYQPGFENVDTYVNGCINLYGVMDLTDSNRVWAPRDPKGTVRKFFEFNMRRRFEKHGIMFQRASPYWRAHPDGVENETLQQRGLPPIMIVHGTLDTLVPINEAHQFWKAIQLRREREKQQEQQQQQQQQQQQHSPGGGAATSVEQPESPKPRTISKPRTTSTPESTKAQEPVPQKHDVLVELPGAHHAFNFLLSPRTLAFGDAVNDFLRMAYETQRAAHAKPKL